MQLFRDQRLACRALQRRDLVAIAAGANPLGPQRRKPLADVVILRAGRVIKIDRLAGGEVDFSHRHADTFGNLDIDPLDRLGRLAVGRR